MAVKQAGKVGGSFWHPPCETTSLHCPPQPLSRLPFFHRSTRHKYSPPTALQISFKRTTNRFYQAFSPLRPVPPSSTMASYDAPPFYTYLPDPLLCPVLAPPGDEAQYNVSSEPYLRIFLLTILDCDNARRRRGRPPVLSAAASATKRSSPTWPRSTNASPSAPIRRPTCPPPTRPCSP